MKKAKRWRYKSRRFTNFPRQLSSTRLSNGMAVLPRRLLRCWPWRLERRIIQTALGTSKGGTLTHNCTSTVWTGSVRLAQSLRGALLNDPVIDHRHPFAPFECPETLHPGTNEGMHFIPVAPCSLYIRLEADRAWFTTVRLWRAC